MGTRSSETERPTSNPLRQARPRARAAGSGESRATAVLLGGLRGRAFLFASRLVSPTPGPQPARPGVFQISRPWVRNASVSPGHSRRLGRSVLLSKWALRLSRFLGLRRAGGDDCCLPMDVGLGIRILCCADGCWCGLPLAARHSCQDRRIAKPYYLHSPINNDNSSR